MLLLVYDEQSSDRWLPRVRFFHLDEKNVNR